MYNQFRVQNFRGFKDLELKDLARVNLIAGKNNVGKTALLEAIGIISGKTNIVLARTHTGVSTDNQPRRLTIDVESIYDSKFKATNLFHNFRINEDIQILGIRENGKEDEIKIRYRDRNPDSMIVFIFPEGRQDTIFVQEQEVTSSSEKRYFPLIILFARKKENYRDTIEFFSQLKRQKQDDLLIEALKPIESELKNIDLLSGGLHLNIPRLPELMPLDEMGDGLVRLTNIILAISAVQDGILLIDEIENGLHYSIQTDVWKAIAKATELFNVQIFATTHSFEMLRAAHEAFSQSSEYNFAFHRLYRSQKTGEIDVVSYQQDNMESALEMNLEMR
jgi:AAA15 family ATPase/GTPase